ncbi:protein SET DOMAIN GROUP 41-like, partial [Gastrolobium bilobum]|uniref:protein SET DOMAIN GROUP 41-like n=1 Tax=Gastrolobium bilobum TaxID=150636 RepID=UPI002AB07915
MEMEMEMRAMEDIELGQDITQTLAPLTFSLHNSHIHTHCSACFSLLSSTSVSNLNLNPNPLSPFYCSPPCSAAHSSLHISSAERHLPPSADSCDLRAALRLLSNHRPAASGRVAGLLSNRQELTCQNPSHDDDTVLEVFEKIRVGASAMAAAIAKQRGCKNDDAVLEEATVALCAVLTNAVEVQDNEGRTLGIAVFDTTFSWINHSCSPNACYRFTLSSSSSSSPSEKHKLLIGPFTRHSQQPLIDSGVCGCSSSELAKGVDFLSFIFVNS